MTDPKTDPNPVPADAAERLNRASWDERAVLHGQDPIFYDTEGVLAGACSLHPEELALAGPVDGVRLLHLQCHIGLDSLSWARRGARVTGVDFSGVAIDRARELARRAGVDAEFVRANVCDLPSGLHDRFDLAVATYGIFCWIGDLDAWARNAAAALRPGGRLVVVDLHPLVQMIDTADPLVVDFPYGDEGPLLGSSDTSYAATDTPLAAGETVQWAHSAGEIVTAIAGAGLRIEQVGEPVHADHDFRPGVLTQGAENLWGLDVWPHRLPVLLTVAASKPQRGEE